MSSRALPTALKASSVSRIRYSTPFVATLRLSLLLNVAWLRTERLVAWSAPATDKERDDLGRFWLKRTSSSGNLSSSFSGRAGRLGAEERWCLRSCSGRQRAEIAILFGGGAHATESLFASQLGSEVYEEVHDISVKA